MRGVGVFSGNMRMFGHAAIKLDGMLELLLKLLLKNLL